MNCPYTHAGHTRQAATTVTGAVLPTKYRSVTRHITCSHGARIAPAAQVHQSTSCRAQARSSNNIALRRRLGILQPSHCSVPAPVNHRLLMSAARIRNARNARLKAMQMQL